MITTRHLLGPWLGPWLRALLLGPLVLACTPQTSSPTPSPSSEAETAPEPSAAPTSAPTKAPVMNDFDLGLADDDYWTDPRKTDVAVIDRLWATNQDSVAIGAPQFVSLTTRETLPLVVYRGAEYSALWGMSLREYGQVVAVELEHNRVFVGPVVADDEGVRKKQLNPAEAPAGQGSESQVAELRDDLGLAWQPSTYVITVLLRERASNRVRVELGKQAGAYHDEEVEKFLAAERAKPAAPAVSPKPGKPVPSYEAIEGSPAIPDAIGVTMTGDRVVVLEPGARSILRGAFRLPVLPSERSAEGSAVVGITLVINASDRPESAVTRLQVPAALSGEVATGYFAIDLIAEGLVGDPQTYFVFAFSGETMAGPTPVALVAKDML